MPRYAILVSFPAADWGGPTLVPWEPGLVDDHRLALCARGDHADGSATREWMACELHHIEHIRYCKLTDGAARPCFQTEMAIRNVGTVSAYASERCLHYLKGRGVAVAEMDEPDLAACRAGWTALCDDHDGLSGRVRALVNSATVWSEGGRISPAH